MLLRSWWVTSPPPVHLPQSPCAPANAVHNCLHNTVKSSLIEAGVLDGVNDNFPNTEMCMDYDPQLCYKTDNVSFVSKENIVGYNQSTPPSVLLLLLQPQLPPLVLGTHRSVAKFEGK